jgi:hypothetical protein
LLGSSYSAANRPVTRVKGNDQPPKYLTSEDRMYRNRTSESREYCVCYDDSQNVCSNNRFEGNKMLTTRIAIAALLFSAVQ